MSDPRLHDGASGLLNEAGERRRAKLSDQIYEAVFSLIVSGELPQNSRLPTEAQLCQRFGVSRPIIREALARLRDDGLVFSRQGSGSFVRRQPDRAVLRFAPVNSIADMQRCFEFRISLEGEAAYLAAKRRTPESLARIQAAMDRLEAIIAKGEVGVDADFDLHLAIAAASQNRFFADTMASLQPHIRFGMTLARNLSLLMPRARLTTVQAEHVAILAAITAGEADAARTAMASHIENARRRVFEGSD
ncbi:MAG: FadR family transcriptional regulator [Proteobacteria bacterium]|nr:FadR family transcriptional regulator [Pseudomonadota bacterium]